MKAELVGILFDFEKRGVRLDDHYMQIRHLVESAEAEV